MIYHARFNCRQCHASWGAKAEAQETAKAIARSLTPFENCKKCGRVGEVVSLVEHKKNWRNTNGLHHL